MGTTAWYRRPGIAAVALGVLAAHAVAPVLASGGDDDNATDDSASGEDEVREEDEPDAPQNDTDEPDPRDAERAAEDDADAAEDATDDEEDAADEAEDEREDRRDDAEDADDDGDRVRVRVDDDEVEFRSRSGDDSAPDVEVRFKARDAAIRVKGVTANATADAVDMQVRLLLVIEYVDANGNGRYDLDDRLVQALDVRALPATVTATPLAGGGHVTNTTYALAGNGTFTVTIAMGNATGPREAKIDFAFSGFPYQADDSALALRVEVTSDGARPARSGADGVTAAANGAQAYFRWVDWAVVDGERVDVGYAVHAWEEDGGRTRVVVDLSYPRGTEIVHDPVVGVVTVQSLGDAVTEVARVVGHAPAYAVAAAASAVVAVGAAWLRARR